MKVHFFARNTTTAETESVGTLMLTDGQLVADPPDSVALQNILTEPLQVWQEDGPPKRIDPIAEPEACLKGCLTT